MITFNRNLIVFPATLDIVILDVNDNSPVFETNQYKSSIVEGSTVFLLPLKLSVSEA